MLITKARTVKCWILCRYTSCWANKETTYVFVHTMTTFVVRPFWWYNGKVETYCVIKIFSIHGASGLHFNFRESRLFDLNTQGTWMLQENWHVKLSMPNAKHVCIVTGHLVIHKLVIICSRSYLSSVQVYCTCINKVYVCIRTVL